MLIDSSTQISVEDLKASGKKLFIATPMYGGQCNGLYTKSMSDLSLFCGKHDIPFYVYYIFNESLITRARNYCVDEFLRSDATHLLFIDSDIGFNMADALKLLYVCDSDNGVDVVTAPYPKKTIAWEKIKTAVDAGVADDNPFELANYVGDYVFNPAENVRSFKVSDMIEIKEGGTGFMCIDRKALIKYASSYPELRYTPDHARTKHFDGTNQITAFFDCVIDPESKRYLSEDYMFSQYARKIGLKIWMCPWMSLKHVGSYIFSGSLSHIAQINATPTANKASNQKTYLTNEEEPSNISKTDAY